MEINVKLNIDPSLLRMGSNTREAIINSLAIMRDVTVNETKRLPPGQSFIDRTGNLRNSIIGDQIDRDNLIARIEARMEYGKYVNDGTKYMDGRFFMEKGLLNASKNFENIMVRELDRLL